MENDSDLTASKHMLWRSGLISLYYLRNSQLKAYRCLHRFERPVLEAARRWGKTTTILIYVIEELIRNPGWVCRIALPFKEQARKVWLPEITKIQDDCPDDLKFVYNTVDSVCTNPLGSKIFLSGLNEDKGRGARGTASNIICVDEMGFVTCPEVISSVLSPQLRTTKGKMILASTPPEDLNHEWYVEKSRAIRDGRFLQKTIYEDETLSPTVLRQIIVDCGGPDLSYKDCEHLIKTRGSIQCPAFQREYLCEPVSDPARLVVPEFSEQIHVVDDSFIRPDFFDCYVGADLGFHDFTALLFCYYHFEKAALVIEDELVVSGKNSREIVDNAKEIEKRLWGKKEPRIRVSDNEIQQLYDMQSLCNYTMVPTRKDDKIAAINALRLRFKGAKGSIRIHARCKNLINQLKTGLWNEQRTNYLRSDKSGHLDTIDALVYLNRHIDENLNPFPQYLGIDRREHLINEKKILDKDASALEGAFSIKRFGSHV
jgi:hypothetical protein